MSINSLTESEVRPRRLDARNFEEAVPAGGGAAAPAGGGTPAPPPAENALSMLIKYIPTESVTLYVAAASAGPALKNFSPKINEVSVYWFFGLLTPVLFALVLLGKRRTAGVKPLATLRDWPWWKNFAAMVAFFVWALAVPGLPDIPGDTSGAIAGVFALLISTILSVLEPIFDRAPSPGAQ